ncbi:nitrogen fixation protein NifQ [Rahnella sp. SAP-1]|uniref:Nitrogen fixation protein NifQ n=1 Tax=Rouxiella aceris TaxID=2703884 RepID=A0A848MI32_9GAMM|nr:nitrogen fixation protein NifQ [Rouxiella aceris]NMP26652.1 nitrogen fixation protein NifQ [Rouxiella aceris]
MNGADYWLRRLLALYWGGQAHFPARMGLPAVAWQELLVRLGCVEPAIAPGQIEQQALIGLLLHSRRNERQQLAQWLAQSLTADAAPMHELIATASMGFDHLWQDLGLDSRAELRELMSDCFPELVRLNQQNMRWKKFFYRQQCMRSLGEIVCRAPSCEQCCEKSLCFAEESD